VADALHKVTTAYNLLQEDKDHLVDCIEVARGEGHSWEAIGRAMGITRQGAMVYKRYVTA
jgi:hypothetical protein